MNITEMVVFIVYLLFMLSIGIWFFYKNRSGGEKTYFLGGRQMGPWVTALSAGASDMSAWVLMGLPTSIYALGLGQAWISIGLLTGYSLSWIFQAPRLRRFSIVADDAITIPQYLSNRFLSKSYVLQVICAIVFLIAYTIYSASSIKACGTLFNTVIGIDEAYTMYLAAAIIIGYTFLGGFQAVCWTDFYQGLMILGSLLIAPIFAVSLINPTAVAAIPPDYWNPMAKVTDIISGFGWGLGYFGMPHIIIRFMSLGSQKEMKKSAIIAISWTALICFFATMVGVVGRMYLGMDDNINKNSLVFIAMVRSIFPALMSGVLLSGVLAASMSTASSQLLSSASAFASDVYKPVIRKNSSSDKEMLWAGRLVVLAISFVALLIADSPRAGSIMELVSNAWGVFGAAFGPAIMLSLFWRNFTFQGTVACIVVGALVDIGWFLTMASSTGIYEIIPGFFASLLAGVLVSIVCGAPSKEVTALYDKANNYTED
ncbi:sodium/proline symporter [uncultured Phascolarctobacterium sp.]|uniref:sodium/proline symporter n=1 Tax=uncultured Phascolarctobacterium sp. TaxID=512296 RepID=UPI00261B4F76|nr:sodium/proline symporter [uncultured Phascolarctobacterium sp.]